MLRELLLATAVFMAVAPGPALAKASAGGHPHAGSGHGAHAGGGSDPAAAARPGKAGTGAHAGTAPRALATAHSPPQRSSSRANPAAGVAGARDSKGKLQRSGAAKNAFKRSHPCPATGRSTGACPGYVVDHVVALKRGGADKPSNMQWQTKAAAKEKDRTE